MSPEALTVDRHGDLVLDLRRSVPLQRIECSSHGLELLGRMTDPVDKLANDAQRLAATEGLRWISWEPLVSQVRVVLERPGWLDDVDVPAALSDGELGPPDGGV